MPWILIGHCENLNKAIDGRLLSPGLVHWRLMTLELEVVLDFAKWNIVAMKIEESEKNFF